MSLLQLSRNPDATALVESDNRQAPTEEATEAPGATTTSEPVSEEGAPPKANATGESAASPNATTVTNATNATNTTGKETEEASTTPAPTGCAVKEDPRARAWFAETSTEGTPCVFGVEGDVRDEGSHCIFDNGDFGSNGWCYTAKDRSSWGSCNDLCPLYGPSKQLGKKIEHVDKMVDKVMKVLDKDDAGNLKENMTTDTKVREVSEETPKTDAEAKEPKAEAAEKKESNATASKEKPKTE